MNFFIVFIGPIAKFNNLPEEPIFTMHHHIPDNWLIEPVQSVYDLDNIKLATVEGSGVHSEFELEHLLLEGKNLFKKMFMGTLAYANFTSVIFQKYLAYGIFMSKFLPHCNFWANCCPNIAVVEILT